MSAFFSGASSCAMGIDFGTDSVRCIVAEATSGQVLGSAVAHYPRWAQGLYCDPVRSQFRQHPRDHLESMEQAVRGALREAGPASASRVRGIAVDTTGSTPVLADARGTPLALHPELAENPNAMFVLWKDHTAVAEAERINALAHGWGGVDYTRYVGGAYSSEWFWAKAMHVLETDPRVAARASTILEHCDWIPAVLTGTAELGRFRRSRCAAGHKALWHAEFGGYPSEEFLQKLDPRLPLLRRSLGNDTFTSSTPFGNLSAEWAGKLGLGTDVVVAVGAFDAHVGAVGAGIAPRQLVKVVGTSTCDMVVTPISERERVLSGICGQVHGSILPDMLGYEAGQSAFGDVYAWFKSLLAWPLHAISMPGLADAARRELAASIEGKIIPTLEQAALTVSSDDSVPLALDWMNGRRTPDANQRLAGALTGLRLGTDAPRIYRSLVEATAYGSRAIVERFREQGTQLESVIAIGGVAKKSRFVMQTLADVLNMKVTVPAGDQTVALGAAMFAATVAGVYPTVNDAQRAMSPGVESTYQPVVERVQRYDQIYRNYRVLGGFVESELGRPR